MGSAVGERALNFQTHTNQSGASPSVTAVDVPFGSNLSRSVPYWHYLIIFAVPAVLWFVNPNWPFQNLGQMDPWYYFGIFHHFPRFHNLVPNYAGERMTWIVPGFILVRAFGQVTGVLVLHWTVFLASLYLLHYSARHLVDFRTALLTTVLLGCHPFFIKANGWDYVESISIVWFLTSVGLLTKASLVRNPRVPLLLSAVAWSSVVYSYPVWLVLTPGYSYLVYRVAYQKTNRLRESVYLVVTSMVMGAILTTLAVWAAYHSLGGQGFFLGQTLLTASILSPLRVNSSVGEPFPYRQASWLVFPAFTFGLGAVALSASALRRMTLSRDAAAMVSVYLFSVIVMVLLSIRPPRLLEFEYFASILLPGAFFTLAITLVRVPAKTSRLVFYATLTVGAAISITPLLRPNLYQTALVWELTIPAGLAILAAGSRLLNRSSTVGWAFSVLLFCASNFGLVPFYGLAWRMDYRGRDVSERVSRAIDVIEARLPTDRYPVFWIDDFDISLSAEYRGIMCAFLTHRDSMWHFPLLDMDKHYPTGTRIILITEHRDPTKDAAALLRGARMPVGLVGQDLVEFGGVSYWITHLEVLPREAADAHSVIVKRFPATK